MHTRTRSHSHTCTTHTCAYSHTQAHTHTLSHSHRHTCSFSNTHTHTHVHILAQTCTRSHRNTCSHTHIHGHVAVRPLGKRGLKCCFPALIMHEVLRDSHRRGRILWLLQDVLGTSLPAPLILSLLSFANRVRHSMSPFLNHSQTTLLTGCATNFATFLPEFKSKETTDQTHTRD